MDGKATEKLKENVPYAALEDAEMRADERHKRLVRVIILLIVLLFASNAVWVWAWCQYDYSSTTTSTETIEATQDGKGINMFSGGDLVYGAASKNN